MQQHVRFGTVIFDCDATLSEIEGIEELGREHRAELEALTDAAMDGTVPLQEIYARRLALAQPSRSRVEEVGQLYVERAIPDAGAVVGALQRAGIDVRIVSSGVLQAVLVLSRVLGVPDERVAAVPVSFRSDGAYEGFDPASPLTRAGGKLQVLRQWNGQLARPIMMVGDGATDLETRPAIDMFVAFAGVTARPRVLAEADAVIRHRSLAPVLALALDREPSDEPARSVYLHGLSLLNSNQTN